MEGKKEMSSEEKALLHSWYRFRGNVAPITGSWRVEFPRRMIKMLMKYPFPEVALFYEAEKFGILSMLLFNRRTLTYREWRLLEEALMSVEFNAFCTLQIVKGEMCDTCLVHLSGAVPPEEQAFCDMRYGRCFANPVVQEAIRLVTGVRSNKISYSDALWRIRDVIRFKLASMTEMKWDRLVQMVEEELQTKLRPKLRRRRRWKR